MRPRLLPALLVLAAPRLAVAADPLPYTVTIAATGQAPLDTAARDSSTLVSLREKAPVGPFALVARARGDVGRFEAALHSQGYYLGTVSIRIAGRDLDDPGLPAALDAAPAQPPVTVAVSLTPGPLFQLGRVTLQGDVPRGASAKLGLAPGAPARAADVLAAHDRLLAGLMAEGRALAKVAPPAATLDIPAHRLDIAFDVAAGPVVDLGPITFAGDTKVHESYLRRRFMLASGERYDPARIEKARQDLAAVPALASVRLETPDRLDANGVLPMRVIVGDRPRRAVDLGASFSTDQGGSLTAAWTHRNLFGNAEQLRLSAAATELGGSASRQPGYDVGALLTFPDWYARSQTLALDLEAIRESLDAYDRTALLTSAKVDRKITEEIDVGGGLAFEIARFKQEGVKRTYKLVQVPLTTSYDNTHSLFDPTHGVKANLTITPSYSLGSNGQRNATFVIFEASASTYLDVGRWLAGTDGRSVLALRGLVGEISGATAFDIPPDQRFYAGGGGTVRGYRYQSIGPTFPDRRPAGGTRVEVGSIEFRQRFGESYGAVVFVDAGQVGGNAGLVGNDVLRVGAGAGFRYYTSFGPIRVDIAAPLNKDKRIKTDIVEAYIGLGQAF